MRTHKSCCIPDTDRIQKIMESALENFNKSESTFPVESEDSWQVITAKIADRDLRYARKISDGETPVKQVAFDIEFIMQEDMQTPGITNHTREKKLPKFNLIIRIDSGLSFSPVPDGIVNEELIEYNILLHVINTPSTSGGFKNKIADTNEAILLKDLQALLHAHCMINSVFKINPTLGKDNPLKGITCMVGASDPKNESDQWSLEIHMNGNLAASEDGQNLYFDPDDGYTIVFNNPCLGSLVNVDHFKHICDQYMVPHLLGRVFASITTKLAYQLNHINQE